MAWLNQLRMTAAEFTAANYVLLPNYSGFETDTLKVKQGDGVTPWVSLAYSNPTGGVFTSLISAQAGLTATTAPITAAAATASIASINVPAGTLKTTPIAGDIDADGAALYSTNNTTNGRGFIPVTQYQRLTAAGSTISTIANYFGANSNIPLVASAFYEIDIYAFFLNTTAGTLVWTLTNSAAPTAQNIIYEMSPITGVVAPPGTATMLSGQILNDTTATKALSATGTLSDASSQYMHMKIWLQNGTGTSLKIQATKGVGGTITPGIGSYYLVRQLPATAIGTFAA